MNNIQLPRHFLEDNPLLEISAAILTHFRMTTITAHDINNLMNKLGAPLMNEARYEQCITEKEYIMNLKEAEDIVSYMRKIKEQSNLSFLIQKAIEYQDEVMPLVLKKICTSGFDIFIENAAILTANVDTKYTEQLYDIFPDIRSVYARSEACIVFGVKKKAEYTQLLLEQFNQIKAESPDSNYEQGPLLALHLIYST